MFVDIPFSTRKMKEKKEGIRKEWAEKTNELEIRKNEWGRDTKKEEQAGRMQWDG